jgi:hypothetical protein
MKACGLTSLPDRRTFDRRLSTISIDIKERIAAMAVLFVKEKFVDPYNVTIDSTLLRAKGCPWHKSSMIKGVVPRSGIDTDARWDSVIQSSGYLDIKTPYSIKYGFINSTIICRFHTG